MNSRIDSSRVFLVLTLGAIVLAFTISMSAQVQTQTSTTSHAPTHEVSVARGEVLYVSGNDLIVKMEDGTIRHFDHVPESDRVTVNGQQLGIHDLKQGMKLDAYCGYNSAHDYHSQECHRKSLACESSKNCHSDSGRRHQPAVHCPPRSEIHDRWAGNRCFWIKEGDESNSDKGR